MEMALAALLVSSLTCVGLLALWAATSSRHWFLRTAIFVGTLSLLLLIPAYEPFVAFVLQGAVVVAGVQLARRWRRASADSPAKTQYSLATLLQVMVLVAIASAVAPKVWQSELVDWPSIAIIGSAGGLICLTGCWMRYGNYGSWTRRLLIGLVLTPLLSVALLLVDSFVELILFALDVESPVWLWVPVSLAIAVTTFLFVWFVGLMSSSSIRSDGARWQSYVWRWTTGFVLVAYWCCLALPSAVVYYHLITPLPIPTEQIPEPNGYDDFRAAWAMLGANLLVDGFNFEATTSPVVQLRTAVDQVLPALNKAREGLTRPALHQIDYNTGIDVYIDELQKMRSLARAFRAQGNLAMRDQDIEAVMKTFLDSIDYGVHVRRGGLFVTELVGIACAGVGRSDLYHLRTQLTAEQCRRAIERLANSLANTEPHEQFEYRERVWMQQSYGWFGHLLQILADLTGDYQFFHPAGFGKPFLREQAEMRLLIAELALQAYLLEHDQLPARLAELVPEYLPEVPVDPLSQDSSPLNYRRTDDGYLLYSVGENGIDDGGAAPQVDEDGWADTNTGDLRLDIAFALDEEEETEEDAEASFDAEQ